MTIQEFAEKITEAWGSITEAIEKLTKALQKAFEKIEEQCIIAGISVRRDRTWKEQLLTRQMRL